MIRAIGAAANAQARAKRVAKLRLPVRFETCVVVFIRNIGRNPALQGGEEAAPDRAVNRGCVCGLSEVMLTVSGTWTPLRL